MKMEVTAMGAGLGKYESEFVVVRGSPLVGKSFKEVEKKFKVKFKHYHNPKVSVATRAKAKPKVIIKPYWALKAKGTLKNIAKLRKFSVAL